MIGPAQEFDRFAIAGLYRDLHRGAPGHLVPEVRVESKTLVARDPKGDVIGFAMVVRLDCGVAPYGVIHQLEVGLNYPAPGRYDVREALVAACVSWLRERGVELMYARTVDRGTDTMAMLRYTNSRGWVLDPDTHQVRDTGTAAGDTRPRSGPFPRPIQSPDRVDN